MKTVGGTGPIHGCEETIQTLTFLCACVCAKLLQSWPTLCDPVDCSLPGPSVHGILQERILEWVTMPLFRGSSQPRDQTCMSYVSCIGSLPLPPPGKPTIPVLMCCLTLPLPNRIMMYCHRKSRPLLCPGYQRDITEENKWIWRLGN